MFENFRDRNFKIEIFVENFHRHFSSKMFIENFHRKFSKLEIFDFCFFFDFFSKSFFYDKILFFDQDFLYIKVWIVAFDSADSRTPIIIVGVRTP